MYSRAIKRVFVVSLSLCLSLSLEAKNRRSFHLIFPHKKAFGECCARLVLVLVPQQLLRLVFGGGDGDDDAFLSSIFFRHSPFIIVIVFAGRNRALGKITAFIERERERDSFFKVDSTR